MPLSAYADRAAAIVAAGLVALSLAVLSPRPHAQEAPAASAETAPPRAMRPLPPLTLSQWHRVKRDPSLMRQWLPHSLVLAPPLAPPTAPTATPAAGSWTVGTHPNGAPALANPLLLTDGSVIALGAGCTINTGIWYRLTPDITGSYLNGTWSQIASLPVINGTQYAPRFFSSAVLPDGRVVVAGGEYGGTVCNENWINVGAVYDPTLDAWTAVTAPAGWNNIGDAANVVLANGTLMLSDCCHIRFQGGSPAAALLNEATLAWTATGAGKSDDYEEEGWTLLPNGSVLSIDVHTQCTSTTNGWETYAPATGAWSAGAPAIAVQLADCVNPSGNLSFEMGPQVLRADGSVVAFGASLCSDGADTQCANRTLVQTTHTAIYNSTQGTWSTGPDIPAVAGFNYALADAPAALEPGGTILFAASPNYQAFITPTHFFEMAADNTIAQIADPPNAASFKSYEYHLLVLPTGQIMALETDGGDVLIYTPAGTPNPSWAPAISSLSATVLTPGDSYQVSGTQLNGLSQGAFYGDDQQSATNYPLVRITNDATGHVFYARTFNHSTMSVAPNTAGSTNFSVPTGIEPGASSLVVVANGVASQPVPVTICNALSRVLQNAVLQQLPHPQRGCVCGAVQVLC